jgi:ADP-dependent NAD(P)H-hydrate dehydratase / NAD(P)H-hydrate epimerase
MSPLRLYTADEMRAVDAAAIGELGIPGAVLMERAGLAAAQEIMRFAGGPGRAAVVCGAGNNGGDGFVVARHLHTAGWEVECLLAGDVRRLPPDARLNHDVARKLGIPVADAVRRGRLTRADVVVDALLGTGFRGAPRGAVAKAIEAMRGPIGATVALDVPSGVDGSTGVVAGDAVAAGLTVCFHGRKLGTAVEPGRSLSGRVVVADIGIPPQADRPTMATLLTGTDGPAAWPKSVGGSKYTAGAVLVLGGSPGFVGAPLMTALAALRASAGIAWIAAPAETVPALEGRVPEVMVRALPEGLGLLEKAAAVALGPGLGRSDEAIALARRVAAEHAGPVVIDADGLFAFNGKLSRLRRRPGPTVLTPHEGEMARLLGAESAWVREHRLEAVRKAAAASGCVVLLKGADTLVAEPGGHVAVSHAGPPGLATAGSGDVLTGAVAAMLAKGGDPGTAACIAAEVHGLAGRLAVERRGPSGIIATDVIDALPEALR